MATLELFWDVISPYTYLAVTQLDGLRARTGAEIAYRPFFLGGVMKAAGNTAPIATPAKAPYLLRDLARWREHYGVSLKLPGEGGPFPFSSLAAMRAATAATLAGHGRAACHALFDAYWRDGLDVQQPDVIATVLSGAGIDGPAMVAASTSDATKDALRAAGDEAVRRGAFGAPTMFLGDEMFFGNDRLHFVEAALRAQKNG